MMARIYLLIVLFYLNAKYINSARILAVFPMPSISHQIVYRKLIDGLVKRGHEITVITTDSAYPAGQAPINLKEIDLHDISYKIWKNELLRSPVGEVKDLSNQINILIRAISTVFKVQLKTKEVQDIINKRTGDYDLLLLEACVKPSLIFSHIYKVPVIQVNSFGVMDDHLKVIGAPTHPLLYPSFIHQKLYNLTIWEKIQEIYNHVYIDYYFKQIDNEDDDFLKSIFGHDTPTVKQLANNVQMLFLNVHPIWVENRPVPPSVVFIGGIHTNSSKELPKDLKTYLDSSKNGVIYFSLGSNVDPTLLPPEKVKMIIKVFSELSYDVLWKWNNDELPGRSRNIKISKWFPQSDLLRHPKIKLFITQGGLQSTDEAIAAGVPLVGIPMLGDQWYNVEKYVHHKIGVRLDLASLSESQFRQAILTIINDQSFRDNIVKLRTIMADHPQTPLERAVWWTEHVLRHGGAKHLRAAGANITWAEYFELELVGVVLIALFCFISISVYILWKLFVKLKSVSNDKLKTA